MGFIEGLLIGAFMGTLAGVLIAALCRMAGLDD